MLVNNKKCPNSPLSSNAKDEYDFEECDSSDFNKEEDEETETDVETRDFNHLEIKEQMYQDKLASLKKQLQQLQEGSHIEYNKKLKRLEIAYKERILANDLWRQLETEMVEKEYINEKKAAARELEDKKIELKESIIQELEDKKKMLQIEKQSLELTGDLMEVKPVTTRKLRRRPHDPAPVPEKRRKSSPSQLNFLLVEEEILADLDDIKHAVSTSSIGNEMTNKEIEKRDGLTPTKKNFDRDSFKNNGCGARIEDGKLFFERKWFHRGQPIFVEGQDINRFPAVIAAVTPDAVVVRKLSDNSRLRINLPQLIKGRYAIRRRAS